MRGGFLVILLSITLAGCLSAPPVPERSAAPTALAVTGSSGTVPCEAVVGPGTSDNIAQLDKLTFPTTGTADTGEAAIRGDLALVAQNIGGGFHVVDISDPENMVLVKTVPRVNPQAPRALDIEWSPNGDAAYVGAFDQIDVYDMTDPLNPVFKSRFRYQSVAGLAGAQAHMVESAILNGKEYVYAATQTDGRPAIVLERNDWNLTFRGAFGLLTATGVPVSANAQSTPLGNHDPLVIYDEIRGEPTLYFADGLAGWSAWDVDDPTKPSYIGGSAGVEPPGYGYVHTVRVGFYDGKRIVATMTEAGQNTLKLYDATNLQVPILLARWNFDHTNPHAPQHVIQLLGDHLYMAHYREGVFIFDIREAISMGPYLGTLELAPIAHWAVEVRDETNTLGFNNVWDVLVKDGVVYANDRMHGFYALEFGCITRGDPTLTAVL